MTTLRHFMPRNGILASWEKVRNTEQVHWAMECFAEMLGVFIYVYFGIGSTAPWVIGNIMQQSGLSSSLQVGFAYSIGIIFAICVCASTSGGHFNPCVTIAFSVFKKFPVFKALRYILAQTLGAYMACIFVYYQWKEFIDESEALLVAAGSAAIQFTPDGIPGIFVPYIMPGQTLSRVFMNEFVNCTVIGLIIWAALDPTNYLVPPFVSPLVIGFAYGNVIWGFGHVGIALNSARDLGARLMAITIWGLPAAGGTYAAVASLTNIPATLLAACIYEFLLADSDRAISGWHMDYINHIMNHGRRREEYGGDFTLSENKGNISDQTIEQA